MAGKKDFSWGLLKRHGKQNAFLVPDRKRTANTPGHAAHKSPPNPRHHLPTAPTHPGRPAPTAPPSSNSHAAPAPRTHDKQGTSILRSCGPNSHRDLNKTALLPSPTSTPNPATSLPLVSSPTSCRPSLAPTSRSAPTSTHAPPFSTGAPASLPSIRDLPMQARDPAAWTQDSAVATACTGSG